MIIYDSSLRSWLILFSRGSVLEQSYRQCLAGFFTSLAVIAYRSFEERRKPPECQNMFNTPELRPDNCWEYESNWVGAVKHPFLVQIFALLLGYMVVIRSRVASKRYTDGMTLCETTLSKWLDAYIMLCVYWRSSVSRVDPTARQRKSEAVEKYIVHLAHFFSMLSAFAFTSLAIEIPTGSGPIKEQDKGNKSSLADYKIRKVDKTTQKHTIALDPSPIRLVASPGQTEQYS